ncbi:MAG: MYXO-CTERM sorting domain-containing protein [Sandaracinaceae bacterium]
MLRSSTLALALVLSALAPLAAQAQDPIVYARCARTTDTFELTADVTVGGVTRSASRTLHSLDVLDAMPDVVNFFGDFAGPCDLVYREPSGAERVLYDCSSTSTDDNACAAMEPSVSFDGQTIAFAVFHGQLDRVEFNPLSTDLDPAADRVALGWMDLPNRVLRTTHARLHLVDVATGVVTDLPWVPGVFDAAPAFLPNGRLAFTSTRDQNRSTLVWQTTQHSLANRIWSMDLDGRNIELNSHHSLSQEQHPMVLQDGRLAYSSWQIGMSRPFRYTNGSIRGTDTLHNLFHLFAQEPDGAENFAIFGMHSGDHQVSSYGEDHDAAHFMTQTGDGRVWFADYYRGNNGALGAVVGFLPERHGIEGAPSEDRANAFLPGGTINLAAWSRNEDVGSRPMPAPPLTVAGYDDPLPFVGKLGHPAAVTDSSRLMVAWGKGYCFRLPQALGRLSDTGLPNTPGCDLGLYLSPIPSMHPNDLEVVVDSPDWHELMGRAVVPYSAIHGMEAPANIPRSDVQESHSELDVGTPFGLLGAASIVDRETHPLEGLHFDGLHQFHQQGTDTIDYSDEELCGVRILGAMPNRGTRQEVWREMRTNPAGERLTILGEIPVRNRDGSGPIAGPGGTGGDQDTSFLVRFPADVAYFMQGIDCDGRTLNTDQSWQALRPGETKTCGGCHVHSREPATTFAETYAASDAYVVPRLGEGQVPLLTGTGSDGAAQTREVEGYGLNIDFETDIMPIFEARCVSCHGGATPDAGLSLDRAAADVTGLRDVVTATGEPATWHCLVQDATQECVAPGLRTETHDPRGFRRPQLTRYIRAYNSRASLLYWKAANERTDNHTDATFDASSPSVDRDIDFGADHPTDITPEELGLISRWIDIGSPGGLIAPHDTQRPTLNLAAILDGEAVTALRVGTADMGDGIDPSSLTVCVLGPEDACDNIAPPASMAGVVEMPIRLMDPDAEVLARVADLAGNITEIRRTVRWLLRSPPEPPPPPVRPDGGVFSDGGGGPLPSTDGGPGTGVTDGCGCRVGGRQSGAPWALWVLFALWVVRRRRRPRGSRTAERVMRGGVTCLVLLALTGCDETMPMPDAAADPDAGMSDAGDPPGDGGARDAGRDASTDANVVPDAGPPCADATEVETMLASGMRVLHHDGQSFVSWRDREEGAAGADIRYRLLRSSSPITNANLDDAEVVAAGIFNHSGQLYGAALRIAERLDPTRDMRRMANDEEPLAPWSGMWAATAEQNGCMYYAVQATDLDGAPIEAIAPGENATTEPVAELVAPREPIQRWTSEERAAGATPTIVTGDPDLPLRVRLHASGGLVGAWGDLYEYAVDSTMAYQDGVPGVFAVQQSRNSNFDKHLELSGTDRVWRPDGSRTLETFWFGYVLPDEDGDPIAHPFTERRLLWTIPWVIERYSVDDNRVICEGGSMGAWGCMMFGIRHPELFAAVYPDRPRIVQGNLTDLDAYYYDADDDVVLSDGTPWTEYNDAARYVRSEPDQLPFIGWNTGRRDTFQRFADSIDMVEALEEAHWGFAFAWNDGGHSEGLASSARIRRWYPPELFARNLSYPAFGNSSINDDLGTGDLDTGDPEGGINLGFVWTLVEDTADRWTIELRNELAPAPMTVDVTPRDTQAFLPTAGESVSYSLRRGGEEVLSGTVTADRHGLVTLEGVSLNPDADTEIRLTR